MNKPLYLLWTLIACIINSVLFAETVDADVRFKRLLMSSSQAEKGIGATTGIAQDKQGFIWLVGENGVLRYDGVSSKHYIYDPSQPSINSNYVRSILVDEAGVIWIGTDLGLCYFDPMIDNFRCYSHDPSDPTSISDNTIYSLIHGPDNTLYIGTSNGLNILGPERAGFTRFFTETDSPPLKSISGLMLEGQDLWIGTADNGFAIYNIATGKLESFAYVQGSNKSVNFPHVRNFLRHSDHKVWIGTYGGGLSLFDLRSQTFEYYRHDPQDEDSIASDVIWDSYRDSSGTAWFATDHGGLSRYDHANDSFTNFSHDPYDPNSLASNQVRVIFEDTHNNLWFGNFPHGVSYWDRSAQPFKHWISKAGSSNALSHSAVLSFLEDRNGIIWIGTESGLNAFDPRTGRFKNFLANPGDPHALQAGPVLSLAEDQQGFIWVGTWSGGLHRLNPHTHVFTQIGGSDPKAFEGLFVWKIIEDHQGMIWVATENNGLNVINPETLEVTKYLHDKDDASSISSTFVLNLFEDAEHNLWVATTNGFDRFDRSTEVFHRYKPLFDRTVLDAQNVGTTRYRSIAQDRDGNIWVGTQNNGIFVLDPTTNSVRQIDLSSGLPANFVGSFALDKQNTMWAATTSGVAKIETSTLRVVEVLTTKNGLVGNNHNRDATLVDRAGNVYLGSIDGVTFFNPHDVSFNAMDYPVVIKDFKILNQSVKPNDPQSPLTQPLAQTDHIRLQHHHSMITFEYAALNYQAPQSMQYAYRLKGFDRDWNYVGDKTFATYTNLNHGRYVFEVKARTLGKDWLGKQAMMQLSVSPPPWKSWWSYALYLLCSLAVIGLLVRLHFKRVEFKAQKSLNHELIKLNKIKDAFLANTSHELRTPLNGIIGIAESVVEEARFQLSDSLRAKLELIAISGKRLSGLINDILDYTKLGHSKLIILPRAVNLYEIIGDVFALLRPLADEKGIVLVNQVSPTLPLIFADENRLQQILINLVGNSIKYSDGGEVQVGAQVRSGMAYTNVTDSGMGIPQNQLDQVFKVFQQADNNGKTQGGTGLGLAVTKELVELHGGQVTVTSQMGVGSCFTFSIPLYNPTIAAPPVSNTSPTVRPVTKARNSRINSALATLAPVQYPAISTAPSDAEQFTLLVVDDDAINRMVLRSMLELHHYNIVEARDGMEALAAVKNHSIDLIILDLMMPKLDGFSVCETLRQDYKIHELPIILLTAKKVDEDVARGFAAGANEFLTKPVSKFELLPRVANHIHLLSIYRQFTRRD